MAGQVFVAGQVFGARMSETMSETRIRLGKAVASGFRGSRSGVW